MAEVTSGEHFTAVAARWRSIPDAVAAHAACAPDAIAVGARGECLSYRRLSHRVDAFAARLQRLLTPDNRLVAVCLERTVDLPAWLLALMRIGAAYLPIDPTLPPARIEQMLDDAAPALILASRATTAALPTTDLATVVAEDEAKAPALPLLPCDAAPDALAYVIYTSGSTGRPKGVEIEQRALVAMLDAIRRDPGMAAGERLMALTRLGFDLSVVDIFLPLFVGGELVLIELDEAADPRRLAAAFDHHRPDLVQATPATWRALMEAGWHGTPGTRILCGGEAMTRDLAERLLPRCRALWNVYGPTETTVWSTAHRVTSGSGAVPIGRPIVGTSIRIADDALGAVPAGEVGEIVIAGPSVARGYRGAPELTQQRFVTLDSGERAYRTGDLGRADAQGVITCLGRNDDQVKVRGFRIELGDVEAAMAAHPCIGWCAARVWTDASGESVLVGYVVARHGGALASADLRTFLSQHLPSYMVPTRFVPMVTMPLNANGKVDRGALPPAFGSPAAAAKPASAPTAGIEHRLAAIWSELLSVADVARDDDFFELGGYSLLTVRLLRRVEQEFGRALEIAQWMRASTLATLAALIAAEPVNAGIPMLLNDGGTLPPLFWLDAGPLIRGVARAMPSDRPVMALNVARHEEDAANGRTLDVAEVAAVLRYRLCDTQPTGPYHIAGWCRWGVVAYELACQLRERGHEIAGLVMLDATVDHPADARSRVTRWGRRLVRPWLPRGDMSPSPVAVSEEPSFSQRVEQAAARYVPRALDTQVLLIRSAGMLRGDARGGWQRHVAPARLHVRQAPGDHVTVVRPPHAAVLAQVIDAGLRDIGGTPVVSPPMVVAANDSERVSGAVRVRIGVET